MDTFPYHALGRAYTSGYPQWRPVDAGVASMQLGNGILRSRDELGAAAYAVDLRIDHITQAAAGILWAHWLARGRGASTFWWSDPGVGPLSAVPYATYECRYAPDAMPLIVPKPKASGYYDAQVTLLPVFGAVAEATLVGHWLMNDNAASTTVADDTGNGHTGTASHNTDTLTVAGKLTTALEFVTASSRYVSVADHADLELEDGGTIAMWVKWDGTYTASGGTIPRLIAKYGSWYLRMASNSGALYWYPISTASPVTTANGALVSGTWRHITVSFSSQARKIYVDGADATVSAGDSTMPTANAAAVLIGANQTTAGFFGGALDDVRIYQRPLSAQEILAIYNAGTGTESEVVT